MKIKNYIFWLAIILSISCNNKETTNTKSNINKPETKNIEVKTYIIKPDTFYTEILSNGKLQAINKAELKFKLSENIKTIYVHNNQFVKRGQIIAELDNTLQQISLQEAQNDMQEAELNLQAKIIEYGYDYKDHSSIPKDIYKVLTVKSGYLKAQNRLLKAQTNYNYTILKSPINGIIANLTAKQNNYINTTDVFCTVIDNSVFETSFTILENEVNKIKEGDLVTITTFLNNKKYNGVISDINPQVDINGLITVKANIKNTDGELIEGMNTQVNIKKPAKQSIVIPKQAVVNRSNKKVVFTCQNNRAKWNYVTISDENSQYYNISDGLNIGDTVIVEGNLNLSHDAKISVIKP